MSEKRHAVHNGRIIDEKDAVLPITLREVQSNLSVYEALRVIEGHVVHLGDHVRRLEESAAVIHLPLSKVDWQKEIDALIEKDHIVDATMRILVVGTKEPLWFITWSTLLTYPDSYYREGVDVTTYKGERFLPQCKTGNLLLNYLSREEASRQGAFEALLVDDEGLIREGSRSNFYIIKGNVLTTAPDDTVLDGVTRISVLRAARELGYSIEYRRPEKSEIFSSDSSFISSTSMGAMPIKAVDGERCPMDRDKVAAICALVRKWERE